VRKPVPLVDMNFYLGEGSITSFGAGTGWTCASMSSGALGCWGANGAYQLGQGAAVTAARPYPQPIVLGTGTSAQLMRPPIVLASTGSVVSNANLTMLSGVYIGGKLYLWGRATFYNFTTPTAVAGFPDNVVQVSLGGTHVCALTAASEIYCQGRNYDGQLGNGNTVDQSSAVKVVTTGTPLAGKQIEKITSAAYASCALTTDGTVACWGDNGLGQLGNTGTGDRNVPTALTDTNGVLSSGRVIDIDGGSRFFCAAKTNGVACWGENVYGNLGNGATSARSYIPVAVADDGVFSAGVTAMDSGEHSTCAIAASNSRMYCWGYNGAGGLGITSDSSISTTSMTRPTLNAATTAYRGVVVGAEYSCGYTATAMDCWGKNTDSQLGRGAASSGPTPIGPVSSGTMFASGFASVAAGSATVCAATLQWSVVCWGSSNYYQAGRGVTTSSLSPDYVILASSEITGMALECPTGSLLVKGGSCSLVTDRTYYYRVTYSVPDAPDWVSAATVVARS